jgi:hypothetical protein
MGARDSLPRKSASLDRLKSMSEDFDTNEYLITNTAMDRNTGIECVRFVRAANSKRHNRCREASGLENAVREAIVSEMQP